MSDDNRKTILIIDDEMEIRGFLCDFFEDRDYIVETAANGEEGVKKYSEGKFDLVICDMLMPGMIGIDVLRNVKEINKDQRFIMMTGVKEATMVAEAKELGCYLYLNKPVGLNDLEQRVAESFKA